MLRLVQEEIVELLRNLIRNRCVNPPGGEMRSIQTVNRFLESYGIQTEIFESAPERGNLLAEILGSSDHPSFMFGPAHVDVVPVEDEGKWSVPPFEGVIRDDCIWGRGALDMLFIVACQTVAFAHLHRDGFKPKGDFKLLIVADEEASGNFGANWMVQNYPEKVKVDYLITEMGGYTIAPNRTVITYGEKGTAWSRLVFKGVEQHGSMPYGMDNAIVKLAKAVCRLTEYQAPRDVSAIHVFLDAMGIGGIQKFMLTHARLLPTALRIASKRSMGTAKLLHALSQMTISPNVCHGGAKVNIVPGQAYIDLDIRTLPGQGEEYVNDQLRKALGPLAEEVEIIQVPMEEGGGMWYGNSSDPTSPFVDLIEEIVKDLKGAETKLVPMIVPGATDCKFFRKAWDTQAYGFSLLDDTIDMEELVGLIHGDDERVSLGTLDLTYRCFMEIAKRFLG
jgi:acetylornithine deacetylase/succinyl-diaminopimelate desuccinylase-like protein